MSENKILVAVVLTVAILGLGGLAASIWAISLMAMEVRP